MKRKTCKTGVATAALLAAVIMLMLPIAASAEKSEASGGVVILNDPWAALPNLPAALSRSAGAVVDGRFFVIGGEEIEGTRNGYVQEYDPVAGTWDNTNAVMPTPAANLCAAVIGTEIFIPGGWTGEEPRLADLQVYDTATDTWQTVDSDPLPAGRHASACTAHGGKIYVFGGTDDSDPYVNTTYIYDPAAAPGSRWTTGAATPIVGGYGNAIAAAGFIYWAGMRNTISDLADVYRYDPADDSWTAMPSLTTARGGAQVWTYDGKFAVGGGGWNTYLNTVEEYDLSAGTGGVWTEGNSMVTGRRSFAAAQDNANGVLYAAGGWDGAFIAEAEASNLDSPPNIDVDPLSLSSTQPIDTITGQTLSISNTGGADLVWEIFEAPAGAAVNARSIEHITISSTVCDNPSDVPWLSVDTDNGTTAPGETTPVDVIFDSTGLAVGTYSANLCIFSNDPDNGTGNGTELVIVPVDLGVVEECVTDTDCEGDTPVCDLASNVCVQCLIDSDCVEGWSCEENVCISPCELSVRHKRIRSDRLTKPRRVALRITSLDENFDIYGLIDIEPFTWQRVRFNQRKNLLRIRTIVPAGLAPGVYSISVGDCFGEVVVE